MWAGVTVNRVEDLSAGMSCNELRTTHVKFNKQPAGKQQRETIRAVIRDT